MSHEMSIERERAFLLREKYNGVPTPEFFLDEKRLRDGEPLAYIIGYVPFLDTTIYLDSRPLIPRTETEFWVSEVIDELKEREVPLRILDLCAGSGCIGVALLAHLPQAIVDFVEEMEVHHATIARNLEENRIEAHRARIFGGSLFERAEGPYDVICTNPPYIDESLGRIAPSVRDHEPAHALISRDGGYAHIREIIATAPSFLAKAGSLWIEHEPEHMERISVDARAHGFRSTTHKDQYGVLRYSHLTRTDS